MKKLGLALLALASLSCERGGKQLEPTRRGVANLPTFDTFVYPLASGSSYLVSSSGRAVSVHYLRGTEAVEIENVVLHDDGTIYPQADGSAYLTGRRGQRSVVYYLFETTATEIREVSQLSASDQRPRSRSSEGFVWATLQSERSRTIQRAREAEEAKEAEREE
jgi:hypothetical protein